ncbi:hypothetical protein ACJX0J_009651, partial [Zea mays]
EVHRKKGGDYIWVEGIQYKTDKKGGNRKRDATCSLMNLHKVDLELVLDWIPIDFAIISQLDLNPVTDSVLIIPTLVHISQWHIH